MDNESLNRVAPSPANRGDGQGPVLLGVKRQDWRTQKMGRGLGRKLAERGEIAYWVVTPEQRSHAGNAPIDARRPVREPRLRSAKLLDGTYRFLCEGRICDRSREGLRLTLSRDMALPPRARRAYRRNVRSAPGKSHLASRVDNRDSTVLGRAGGRAAALRSARAEGTLLRDSRLSVFTHSSSPRPRPSSRGR